MKEKFSDQICDSYLSLFENGNRGLDKEILLNVFKRIEKIHTKKTFSLLEDLKKTEKANIKKYGIECSTACNRFILYLKYVENIDRINQLNVTDLVKNYIREDFGRAYKLLNDAGFQFSYENYVYFSYMQVLSLKRYPVGVCNLDVSFFCRGVLFKQTCQEGLSFIKFFFLSRGSRPYFQMHYNPHRFRHFTARGWQDALSATADLLALMPKVKGVCGAAWFFDPQLESVSPEICYVRKMFESAGGRVFYNGREAQDMENAFAMSKKRRDAHLEGSYQPTNYLMILPRKRLLSLTEYARGTP